MAKLTESVLRNIVKEELKKVLFEEHEPLKSWEEWLSSQKIDLSKIKPADKEYLQQRYKKYKENWIMHNKQTPEEKETELTRQSYGMLRQNLPPRQGL